MQKSILGYLSIPETVLDTGQVNYFSQSLSNIKIYKGLSRTLNQAVIEQRMIEQNIDVSFNIFLKSVLF